jgi:hypothetical protein
MKRILRESKNEIRHITRKRLQENIDNLQDQFNDLIKQMTLAKISLEQLEQGADSVEVNFHTDTTENHGEY